MKARIQTEAANEKPITKERLIEVINELKEITPPRMSRLVFLHGTEENIKKASEWAGKYIITNGNVCYKNGRKLPVKEISDVEE